MLKRVITKVKGVQNTYLKYRKQILIQMAFYLKQGRGKISMGICLRLPGNFVQILRGKSSRFTGS